MRDARIDSRRPGPLLDEMAGYVRRKAGICRAAGGKQRETIFDLNAQDEAWSHVPIYHGDERLMMDPSCQQRCCGKLGP